MKKETNLCMSCMGEQDDNGLCPLCGAYDTGAYISSYLAPKTFLKERYIIGKLINYCGESALYIGFDTASNRKVTIREYMPDTLCLRDDDGENITVKHDKLPLYKTYLSEFTELHTTLMNSQSIPSIQTVLDVFSENNTAYAVMDYLGGISLKTYLSNCGEVISWEQVKELFLSLLTALNMLHGLSIIHRGISPLTIFVSEKNELRLTGFSISAAHTADSEIGYEVFGGFAPPEQYSSLKRNGSWTDVYGICAVLYRCLTGITPPAAPERLIDDNLSEPTLIKRKIPKNVSDVIMRGLELESEYRIPTINELVDRLFEQPARPADNSGELLIPDVKALSDRKNIRSEAKTKQIISQTKKEKEKARKDKIKFIIVTSILGTVIFGFLIAMIITASNGGDVFSPTSSSTVESAPISVFETYSPDISADVSTASVVTEGEKHIVPNFSGARFDDIMNKKRGQYSFLDFEYTFDFSDEYESGIIMSQSIEDGTEVSFGVKISLVVSKGPEKVKLPDYDNMTVADYESRLLKLGIKYRIEQEESAEIKEGYVLRCSKGVGEDVSVAEGEEVIIYSAKKPTITTPQTTTKPEETTPVSTTAVQTEPE